MAGKLPDFDIVLTSKDRDTKKRYATIGVAWWNTKRTGMILRVNPGTVIDFTLLKEFTLGLFTRRDGAGSNKPFEPLNRDDVGDDGMPF